MREVTASSVVLWWLPVGAGGHVVRYTSHWWELGHAWLARREPRRLFHAALEARVDDVSYAIEVAPTVGGPRVRDRGVVRTGPVGVRALGRWDLFRYEVRCWRDGSIPDLCWAEGGPTMLSTDERVTRVLIDRVRYVPVLVWGRSVRAADDMWNSNSVVSWLIATTGIDAATIRPPDGGWAPGWEAGLAVAASPELASS